MDVTFIVDRKKPGVYRVYNLEIEHEHEYFVSKMRVLVHNATLGQCGESDYNETAEGWYDTDTGQFLSGKRLGV